jgi:hypothetical protein
MANMPRYQSFGVFQSAIAEVEKRGAHRRLAADRLRYSCDGDAEGSARPGHDRAKPAPNPVDAILNPVERVTD